MNKQIEELEQGEHSSRPATFKKISNWKIPSRDTIYVFWFKIIQRISGNLRILVVSRTPGKVGKNREKPNNNNNINNNNNYTTDLQQK